jgi:hypothetical protein
MPQIPSKFCSLIASLVPSFEQAHWLPVYRYPPKGRSEWSPQSHKFAKTRSTYQRYAKKDGIKRTAYSSVQNVTLQVRPIDPLQTQRVDVPKTSASYVDEFRPVPWKVVADCRTVLPCQ